MAAFSGKKAKKASGNENATAESVIGAMMGSQTQDCNPVEAIAKVFEVSAARKFNESFELILKLNVDPTQGDQNVRGTCILPAGTGQSVRVCVFADKEFHGQLTELGADVIGDAEVLKQIAAGEIHFDKIVTTPEHMNDLKQMARILGPKGLMPNVKSGNLVKPDDLLETVK